MAFLWVETSREVKTCVIRFVGSDWRTAIRYIDTPTVMFYIRIKPRGVFLRHHTHNGSGVDPAFFSYPMVTGSHFWGGRGGRGITLTHLHLLPRLRVCRVTFRLLMRKTSRSQQFIPSEAMTITLQDVYYVVSTSTEGAWSTPEAFRGLDGETERHFAGRADLGSPCIRLAHSAIQSVLEPAASGCSVFAYICVGESSDSSRGKKYIFCVTVYAFIFNHL